MFADQWARAFEIHPKVVMLTWWNEWVAQRQANDGDGNPQFVDEYDSGESARDAGFQSSQMKAKKWYLTHCLPFQNIRGILSRRIQHSLMVMGASISTGPGNTFPRIKLTVLFLLD